MPNLRAYLCNCLIGGHTTSRTENGEWIRDKIVWNLDGFDICLRQKKEIVQGRLAEFKGVQRHTTDLVVENVSEDTRAKALDTVMDLSVLLSLISESRIWPFRWEYPEGTGLWRNNHSTGTAQYHRPPVDILDGGIVRQTVELVWSQYKKVKTERNLNEVIHYLCLTELPENPLELKLIVCFIILENLKDTWAKATRIPFGAGFFRKVSNPPKANIKKEPIYGFEEMLGLMLKEMKMRRGLKRIVKLRNDLIHIGLSRRPPKSTLKSYEVCRDIIREYLLRMVGYSGPYRPYSAPNSTKMLE